MNRDKDGTAITDKAPQDIDSSSSDNKPSSTPHRSLKAMGGSKPQNGTPSQLSEPVSLKAETSDPQPTENGKPNPTSSDPENKNELGNKSDQQKPKIREEKVRNENRGGKKSLKEMAESNPSMLGDPVSLKAESADSEPTDGDRGAKGGKSKL